MREARPKLALLWVASALLSYPISSAAQTSSEPLIIKTQGSFSVGGSVIVTGTFSNDQPVSTGQSLHADSLYAFYQIPENPNPLPIVMLHGAYVSGRSWETTPDGREGFQSLFLRRHFSTYIVDQPRRGRSGSSSVPATLQPAPNDQLLFDQFRFGTWPNYFEGVQLNKSADVINQFFYALTPNTGPFDPNLVSEAMSSLFEKVGPGILFTHSQGGGPGWLTAIKNKNVRGVVALEPGSGFVFPEDEVPAPMQSATGPLTADAVSLEDFQKLTRIPIIVFYGDNIPSVPTEKRGQDNWRVRLAMAKLWADAINRHGGDAKVVVLPEIGIRGNTHFLMSDLNNVEIANQIAEFLREKHLD